MIDYNEARETFNKLISVAEGAPSSAKERSKILAEASVGDLVRDFRQEIGLSETAFAKKISVSDQSVRRWEKNHALPTLDALKTWADLLPGGRRADTHNSDAPLEMDNRFVGIYNNETIRKWAFSSDEVWVMRAGGFFRVGYYSGTRAHFRELLCRGIKVKIVFRDIEDDSRPRESMRKFCKYLMDERKKVGSEALDLANLELFPIDEKNKELLHDIGMSRWFVTSILFHYSRDYELKVKRPMDLVTQIPIAEYQKSDGAELTEHSYDCWCQVDIRRAEEVWSKHLQDNFGKLREKHLMSVEKYAEIEDF